MHILNPCRHPNTVPGPFHIVEMALPVLSHKHIGIPFHPGEVAERGDQGVGHGQEMRAPRLRVWDSPLGPGQTHILPSHGQHLGASRAGQERGQHDRTDSGIRFFRDRLKEPREFLRLHEPIARFLSKHLNARGGIVPRIQALVPRQIEHLPKQGHEAIGTIGGRLPDLGVEARHIIPVEIREFPRSKH